MELKVGGQLFRVVASAEAPALQRYARVVDEKLQQLTDGDASRPQAMLLVAIALAHELEELRQQQELDRARAREMLSGLLERVNRALDTLEDGEPAPPASLG